MTSHAVSIIGAGDMGHGFATHFAIQGQDVTLVDHRQSNLDRARERIRNAVSFLVEEELSTSPPEEVLEAIEFTLDTRSGVSDADIVLETVPESLELKQEVFSEVGAAAPSDAVLASNTSGIPPSEIVTGVPEYSDRIVVSHWWYPPYLLTPVEVVPGEETSEVTTDRLVTFVEAVDRDPIMVENVLPGFVWNRVQRAIYRECLYMVEKGVASMEDINRAIRDGYAVRTAAIGPLETIDIAGLEPIRTVTERIQPTLCNDEEPSRLFDENIERGRGGIEDGAGFFDYDDSPGEITRVRDEKVAAIRRALGGFDSED